MHGIQHKWAIMVAAILVFLCTTQRAYSEDSSEFSITDYDAHLQITDIVVGPIESAEQARAEAIGIWSKLYSDTAAWGYQVLYDAEYKSWMVCASNNMEPERHMILTQISGTLVGIWEDDYTEPALQYIESLKKQKIPPYKDCGEIDISIYSQYTVHEWTAEEIRVGAVTSVESAAARGFDVLFELYGVINPGALHEVYYDQNARCWLIKQCAKDGTTYCVILTRVTGRVEAYWIEE